MLLILSFFSCKKEKIPDSIIGKWQLQEIIGDSGGKLFTTSVGNTHEASVLFASNGEVVIKRSNITSPFLVHLAQFSHYHTEQNGVIRFYNSNGTDTLNVSFSLDNELLLEYESRCYYAEKFVRTY